MPKIFVNGQFHFNLSSKTWSRVFLEHSNAQYTAQTYVVYTIFLFTFDSETYALLATLLVPAVPAAQYWILIVMPPGHRLLPIRSKTSGQTPVMVSLRLRED